MSNENEFSDEEVQISVEGLNERYNDLKARISEYRKDGKDASIPNLMMRNMLPKIKMFSFTKSKNDFNKIQLLFNDIEKELDEVEKQKEYNIKDEINSEVAQEMRIYDQIHPKFKTEDKV